MSTGRCSLRLTRRYSLPPGDVWAALVEPESVCRWLGPVRAMNLVPGGGLELLLDGDGPAVTARVRELEPAHLLELDWRPHGEEPSVVRLELRADGQGTVLVLDHRLLEEPLGMAAMAAWTARLARLEAGVGGAGR